MPTEDTQSRATHFPSSLSLSPLSTNNSFLPVCLFNLSYHLPFSFLLFISFWRLSLSPCLMQVISPPGSQSSCDWSTHLFCIRVPEEQTVVLTTPIKLMTVIKNHTSIISAVDISNGEQVISDGSRFLTFSLSHTQIMHAYTLPIEQNLFNKAIYVIIGP